MSPDDRTGPDGDLTVPSGLDLRTLEYFVTVARLLHFGRAAEQLYIRQSTVSQGVRRLEDVLGAPLFDRSTRTVSLTELGRLFLPEATAALAAARSAYDKGRALVETGTGIVEVGHTADLTGRLGHVLAAAHRRSAGMRIVASQLPSAGQLRALRNGSLDAGICWGAGIEDDVERIVVGGGRLAVVVPTGHPWAGRGSVSLAEVATEPLITWPRAVDPGLYEHLERAMDAAAGPWTVIGTGLGSDNITAQVLSGFGVAVVLDHADAYPEGAHVAYLPIRDRAAWIDRVFVWSRGSASTGVAVTRDVVIEAFAGERAQRPGR